MNVCFKVYLVICRQFLQFQKNCSEGVTCPAESGVWFLLFDGVTFTKCELSLSKKNRKVHHKMTLVQA